MADLVTYDLLDFSAVREFMRSRGSRRVLRKGECFIREREVPHKVGLVESGGFSFSKTDWKGNVQIMSLAFAGELISSIVSLHGRRAGFDVTALCQSTVVEVEAADFAGFFNTDCPAGAYQELIYAIACGILDRAFSFRCESPETRYRSLLDRSPHIVGSITMTAMASYLVISREHFARIRSKFAKI